MSIRFFPLLAFLCAAACLLKVYQHHRLTCLTYQYQQLARAHAEHMEACMKLEKTFEQEANDSALIESALTRNHMLVHKPSTIIPLSHALKGNS